MQKNQKSPSASSKKQEWPEPLEDTEIDPAKALESDPDFEERMLKGAPNLRAMRAFLGGKKKTRESDRISAFEEGGPGSGRHPGRGEGDLEKPDALSFKKTPEEKESYETETKMAIAEPGSVQAQLAFGKEQIVSRKEVAHTYTNPKGKTYEFDLVHTKNEPGAERYLITGSGKYSSQVYSGMILTKDGQLTAIHTDSMFRKIGLGSELIKLVKKERGAFPLDPNSPLSKAGKAVWKKSQESNTFEVRMGRFLREAKKKKKIYYSRPMNRYKTQTEAKNLGKVQSRFPKAKISFPRTKNHDKLGMGYFHDQIDEADRVVLKPDRGTRLTTGVYSEARHAIKNRIPVYALYKGRIRKVRSVKTLKHPNKEGHFGRIIFRKKKRRK